MLRSWRCSLRVTQKHATVLLSGPDGDLLKARLDTSPCHPRALLTLLEGLSESTANFAAVVHEAERHGWTRDPFDRLIVAQAALHDAPADQGRGHSGALSARGLVSGISPGAGVRRLCPIRTTYGVCASTFRSSGSCRSVGLPDLDRIGYVPAGPRAQEALVVSTHGLVARP